MKKSMLFLAGLALAATWTSPSAAQTSAPAVSSPAVKPPLYEIKDGNLLPTPDNPEHADYQRQQIAFRAAANPRKDAYIGFNFGVNAAQQGNVSYDDWGGNQADLNLKSGIGYVSGIRGGYTWQLGGAKDNLLALSLEGEMIYSWIPDTKAGGTYTTGCKMGDYDETSCDLHIWALMTTPVLRFQLGKFVPYIGVGAGGALVLAANPVEGTAGRVMWSDSRYGFAFAFQGITGFDYYFNDSWSLFTEYKYLGLIGAEFNDQLDGAKPGDSYKTDGILGNHIINIGFKFHF